MSLDLIKNEVIELLVNLIKTPSFSGEENLTAEIIISFLSKHKINVNRKNNNIWCKNKYYNENKKTILLNSHHDTVKPGKSWAYDPFGATIEGDKLTGLGSNDAGASAISLLATFLYFENNKDLPFNLIYSITAEEENSGPNNVGEIIDELGKIDLAIVGEPTKMDMAIAERGLVVLDCVVKGKTGHAARNEGENAIYNALPVIKWFQTFTFEKASDMLGPVKMTITQINAGKQHNVVPDECNLVVDVRVNELYTNQEVADIIKSNLNCEVNPRSFRLNSSYISINHPIVNKGKEIGLSTYGSPTLSDQCMMPFESIKIGPGDSARSHTPDEYIFLSEIKNGIDVYINLLQDLVL
ncbi:MAG: M20 family metallo-hydrolase [Solirubrobacteraceae bacterium]